MDVIERASDLDGLPRGRVLVPTMGALHEGHVSLIRLGAAAARERSLVGGCLVSIFINPTQFNDPADFKRYPRTLSEDLDACEAAGASAVYAPPVEDVYPPGVDVLQPVVPIPGVGKGLEDAGRPGHFEGVCKVVRRLFDLTKPAAAVFGEKDWQQLAVMCAMVERDELGVEIIPGPTVREPDGLALSSRNELLNPADRPKALGLVRSLDAAQQEPTPMEAETAMHRVLSQHGINDPHYATIRDAGALAPPRAGEPARALVAATVGGVRLLDNAAWQSPRA